MVGVERDEESRVRSDVRPRDLAGARRTLIAVLLRSSFPHALIAESSPSSFSCREAGNAAT